MSTFARLTAMALLAAAMLPTQAMAQMGFGGCTGSDRVSHADADCLAASFRNKKWPTKNRYDARSTCADYGTVIALIDIKDLTDIEWTLKGSTTRRGSSLNKIRGVYCCQDRADRLCNKSDATAANCLKLFKDSAAWDTCGWGTDTEIKDTTKCRIATTCQFGDRYFWSEITVKFGDANDVNNCNGFLKLGDC